MMARGEGGKLARMAWMTSIDLHVSGYQSCYVQFAHLTHSSYASPGLLLLLCTTLLARLWSDYGQYVIITHRLAAGSQSPRTHLPSVTVWQEVTLQWARHRWPDNGGSSSSCQLYHSVVCRWAGLAQQVGAGSWWQCVPSPRPAEFCFSAAARLIQQQWGGGGGSLLSAGRPTTSQTAAQDRYIACQLIRRPLDRQLLASQWRHTEVKLHWTGSNGTFQAMARASGEDGGLKR